MTKNPSLTHRMPYVSLLEATDVVVSFPIAVMKCPNSNVKEEGLILARSHGGNILAAGLGAGRSHHIHS